MNLHIISYKNKDSMYSYLYMVLWAGLLSKRLVVELTIVSDCMRYAKHVVFVSVGSCRMVALAVLFKKDFFGLYFKELSKPLHCISKLVYLFMSLLVLQNYITTRHRKARLNFDKIQRYVDRTQTKHLQVQA